MCDRCRKEAAEEKAKAPSGTTEEKLVNGVD
jgi:hypothetical protein